MLRWLAKNAEREKIKAILCHKFDRACHNLRDAVCLNRVVSDVNLVIEKKKPFDALVKGLISKKKSG
ncbi:hypothetical protein CA54_41480 [Symmachiella macrocystis]|uniref:Uncharacterized protein n=1 Tax=Symmachiella macrocystis TaxID=2527985 RepID=A0A5C6BC90_9PLAN|nr:hypothetical protein [Symmachiella macrocystis]TWU08909.1 hypothetical protein CA54_41480 [Symmachiella macrocystis]